MWAPMRGVCASRRYVVLVMMSGFTVGIIIVNIMQQQDHRKMTASLTFTDNTPTVGAIKIHKVEETSVKSARRLTDTSSHEKVHKGHHISTTLPPILHQSKRTYSMYYRAIDNPHVDHNRTKLANTLPQLHVDSCNCDKLFRGDKKEIEEAIKYQNKNPKMPIPDDAYLELSKDCDRFKHERQYITKPLSAEEEAFPIAYSIVAFKDVEQIERLLRAIYQPQNYYCIHIDAKSPPLVHRAVSSIAKCFDNVNMASKRINVRWAWFSVLEPDLVCMGNLWKHKKWRYFINLTGQEFPLKTNADLVRILKTYNGANDMEGTEQRRNVMRTEYIHEGFIATEKRKTPPPVKVRITKGSVHITASRDFVDYVLHNSAALKFREWVQDTGVPDETFFSSLNHSPHLGVPGAYTGLPETHPTKYPFMTRFKNWGLYPFDWSCAGQRVRLVCIFGVGDLQLLTSRPELFANKFYLDYQPLALDCMEQLHYRRIKQEVLGNLEIDTTYYEHLSFVQNHV